MYLKTGDMFYTKKPLKAGDVLNPAGIIYEFNGINTEDSGYCVNLSDYTRSKWCHTSVQNLHDAKPVIIEDMMLVKGGLQEGEIVEIHDRQRGSSYVKVHVLGGHNCMGSIESWHWSNVTIPGLTDAGI